MYIDPDDDVMDEVDSVAAGCWGFFSAYAHAETASRAAASSLPDNAENNPRKAQR